MTPFRTVISTCAKCNNPFSEANGKHRILKTAIPKGSVKKETTGCSKIIFAISGEGIVHSGSSKRTALFEGTTVLIPIGTDYCIAAATDMILMEFIVDEMVSAHDLHGYLADANVKPAGRNTPQVLRMNEKLWLYISSTLEFFKDGLGCVCYQEMKVKELFHVLRIYYPTDELARFLSPMFTKTVCFSLLVYDNWDKVDNLDELSALAGLSLSGFSKKFKRIFGVSAYQWIMDKKGARIVDELWSGDKSIKQLTEQYGFYSVQHFGYYCKKRFGCSPGKIRQLSKNKLK